jgi:putative hydrolase of the HAD superfamily
LILNLKPYFHHIYFLPEKGDREFSIIAKECNLNSHMSWSIGNSIKSDINPALRIGMQAILLQKKTWAFEEEVPFEKERLFKARSMRDAFKILKTHIVGIKI